MILYGLKWNIIFCYLNWFKCKADRNSLIWNLTDLPGKTSKKYKNLWRNLSLWVCSTITWSRSLIPKTKISMMNIFVSFRGRNNYPNIWKLQKSDLNFVLEHCLSPKKTNNTRWSFTSICAKVNICKSQVANPRQVRVAKWATVGRFPIRWEKSDTTKIKVQFHLFRGQSMPSSRYCFSSRYILFCC